MRNIPANLDAKLFTPELRAMYQNFEKTTDINWLMELFNINIAYVTNSQRDAIMHVEQINKESDTQYIIASLPTYCQNCYMAIRLCDRNYAANAGLQLMYI